MAALVIVPMPCRIPYYTPSGDIVIPTSKTSYLSICTYGSSRLSSIRFINLLHQLSTTIMGLPHLFLAFLISVAQVTAQGGVLRAPMRRVKIDGQYQGSISRLGLGPINGDTPAAVELRNVLEGTGYAVESMSLPSSPHTVLVFVIISSFSSLLSSLFLS